MQNLYEISEELISIFNEIEYNDGEATEEQLQALEIAQENLQEKLSSYKKAIRVWEGDINACKEEEKRIKNVRTIRENRINKLKDRMLFAIQQFGYDGKPNKQGKTNKFYELPDGRIFTRTTESTEINENRINILINLIIEICNEHGELTKVANDNWYNNVLNLINEKLHIYYESQEDFTLDDLNILTFNYTVEVNILDLILKYASFIEEYTEQGLPFLGLSCTPNKTMVKLALQCDKDITIAKLKETESLTIK